MKWSKNIYDLRLLLAEQIGFHNLLTLSMSMSIFIEYFLKAQQNFYFYSEHTFI